MGFFNDIFGQQKEGFITVVLANYNGRPVDEYWFGVDQLDDAEKFAEQYRSRDVWYSPIVFKEKRRLKDNALTTQVLGADADACEPENFRVRPSLVVQSSPDRYQVYWYLHESLDAHDAAKINRRISRSHLDEGCDPAFVNAAKLMRVPGTSNSKHPGAIVIVSEIDGTIYDVEHMEQAYPASEIPDALEVEQEDMPDGLVEFVTTYSNAASLMGGIPNSNELKSLLYDRWSANKRSDMRWKLLCELYRLGLNDTQVMALAWWAPSNKYKDDDPRGVKGLWDEAVKARHAVADETYDWDRPIGYGDDDEGTETREYVAEKIKPRTEFLTEEEQELITVTWVDEWVTWAGTKTDAPAEYHQAVAITILSAVYGEIGHAFPQFGELKLNIWNMVLGRSTKDRKSTARGYMNKAFRALKTDEYDYDIGDDVTPGGISLALHDRAHKSSVFARDEAQGLFKELMGQSYMLGGLETFTKLYDGWSGGRLRASGEKKVLESVPVSFVMYLTGILQESAEVLTVSNYKSGFLTRFVYVIAKRPDGYKAPPLKQGTEDDQGDPVFDSLINHLIENRGWWSYHKPEGEGATQRMFADEDAWERYIQFMEDANDKAEKSQYDEIIGTTTERMCITVLKLAAIFALDERQKKIKMRHMLQAIAYAGLWYDGAVTVASMVSESAWQRDVAALEEFIDEKGGKVSYAEAYRNFKDKKAFEFDDMVLALERRGVLVRSVNGAKWDLELDYRE